MRRQEVAAIVVITVVNKIAVITKERAVLEIAALRRPTQKRCHVLGIIAAWNRAAAMMAVLMNAVIVATVAVPQMWAVHWDLAISDTVPVEAVLAAVSVAAELGWALRLSPTVNRIKNHHPRQCLNHLLI